MSDINPQHPALVPFGTLDEEQREQDRPYRDAIARAVQSSIPAVAQR
ncbi:DUF7701 domain-containing protein [Cryobacterium melibiosiphilum]|nr:hypothetical protein [Cryobacterium melibiosiphilum]